MASGQRIQSRNEAKEVLGPGICKSEEHQTSSSGNSPHKSEGNKTRHSQQGLQGQSPTPPPSAFPVERKKNRASENMGPAKHHVYTDVLWRN